MSGLDLGHFLRMYNEPLTDECIAWSKIIKKPKNFIFPNKYANVKIKKSRLVPRQILEKEIKKLREEIEKLKIERGLYGSEEKKENSVEIESRIGVRIKKKGA